LYTYDGALTSTPNTRALAATKAMTLSSDEQGLDWMSREDKCAAGDQTIEFYHNKLCSETDGGSRTCRDYDDVDGDAANEAEDDFGDAGGLAAAALTFTVIQIIMVLSSLHAGDKILFCKSGHILWKLVMLFLDLLIVLFVLSAAAVAGESDALDADIGCTDNEITTGYGTGMCAFLVVYVLGKTIFFLCPAPSCQASPAATPGASGRNGFATETARPSMPSK